MNTTTCDVKVQLSQQVPLIDKQEIHMLKSQLIQVYQNPKDYFLLQIGDCAERFEDSSKEIIFKKCNFYIQMSQMLENILQKEVILIGRMAGQYAKPRTEEVEVRNGQSFPIYKGDMINKFEFSEEARQTNPSRILDAYRHAAQVLKFMKEFSEAEQSKKIFTSHEALVLEYEEGLTRTIPDTDLSYNLSAHTVWLGHKARELNGPQVDYLSKIENPIGIKVGPTQNPRALISLLEKLNPNRLEGKIYLVTRFGVKLVHTLLAECIEVVQKSRFPVLWCVDPMHGNTFKIPDGRKVRALDDIIKECNISFEIHKKHGTQLSGLHLEASCDNITECVDQAQSQACSNDFSNYTTQCDPRLNPYQVKQLLESFKRKPFAHTVKTKCITEQLYLSQ